MKTAPCHVESERSVLGSMLRSDKAALEAVEQLRPEDFYNPANREIFAAMQALQLGSKHIDVTTLDAELTRRGKLDAVGGAVYLIELMQTVPTAVNVGEYIKIVAEKSNLRRLLAISESINRASYGGERSADEIIELVESYCNEITTRAEQRDRGWISGIDAALMAYEAAEQLEDPIPTGFDELDEMLCGGLWQPEVTIVGARPGKGKSAFLLAAAMNAVRNKRHVCYFSLEMSAVQIGQRALAASSSISVTKQRYGRKKLTDQDWAGLQGGLDRLHVDGMGEYMHIYQSYGLTLERLTSIVRHAKARGELDLLVLDYIQLLKTVEKTKSDFERLGVVSKGLKQLALSLDIPILTAAQVRRQGGGNGEKRVGRAPTLDELRGSGDLEQDADNVLLIHSPENEDDETMKNIPEKHADILFHARNAMAVPFTVEVAKQRQGQTGRTWCLFKPLTMRFFADGGRAG